MASTSTDIDKAVEHLRDALDNLYGLYEESHGEGQAHESTEDAYEAIDLLERAAQS
jgi:hypothetical protein